MILMRKYYFILSMLIFAGCEKIKYYPDKEYREVETQFLGHRGAGNTENSAIQENTLEATKKGFAILGGVEVDVRLSKDRTVWLSHSYSLNSCGGVDYSCIIGLTDAEIVQFDSCQGPAYTVTRLEDVLKDMAENYPEKYITLDLKASEPCGVGSLDVLGIMNVIAEESYKIVQKYHLEDHVFIESETTTVLAFVKKNCPGIETYLGTTGDFERGMQIALEEGYSGISFKYKFDEEITAEHVQMIRKKGLKIQLYTVDDEEELREALSINPDYIQTNNINYAKSLQAK